MPSSNPPSPTPTSLQGEIRRLERIRDAGRRRTAANATASEGTASSSTLHFVPEEPLRTGAGAGKGGKGGKGIKGVKGNESTEGAEVR